MKNFDRFTNDLGKLMHLAEPIPLSHIPELFQPDVIQFIVGETLVKNEAGELLVSEKMIRAWIHKIMKKGFGYDIDLKWYDTQPIDKDDTSVA